MPYFRFPINTSPDAIDGGPVISKIMETIYLGQRCNETPQHRILRRDPT